MGTSTTVDPGSRASAVSSRVASLDILRGAVMVLMALDHVRDWVTSSRISPENLQQASVALFATRWVTHFCAPSFFLLAGVGAGILRDRGMRPAALSRFLLSRGVWLLILELIITPVGWQFGFHLIPAFALVLWALGWAMIVLAGLVHLPLRLIAAASVVVIASHNLLDPIRDYFHYIIIDCPPSLGILTVNGLTAADSLLVPIQCEYFALEGVTELFETLARLKRELNPNLMIEGLLLTMYDDRTNLSTAVAKDLRDFYGPQVLKTVIPRNVRLAEAPSFGKPIILYDPRSRGANAYLELGKEIISHG